MGSVFLALGVVSPIYITGIFIAFWYPRRLRRLTRIRWAVYTTETSSRFTYEEKDAISKEWARIRFLSTKKCLKLIEFKVPLDAARTRNVRRMSLDELKTFVALQNMASEMSF